MSCTGVSGKAPHSPDTTTHHHYRQAEVCGEEPDLNWRTWAVFNPHASLLRLWVLKVSGSTAKRASLHHPTSKF
ncbi:hypothetical protein FCULG_00006271 [Fusarium culmorum]|uniref:Uncharacterized protein n=1 Tax=Fusarium culmorum TaxID=5516 RepID=A0A2T4GWU7_FUSCU|nr:hypothetical protein FCULG_00006271 [Fusarium culmorum]